MNINNENINIDKAIELSNYQELLLKRRENNLLLNDYQIGVLNRFGIKNYKIASKTHVWNAVFIDGKWLHLDLTWDDPVSERGPMLDDKYFLITTDELVEADNGETDTHIFDKTIYLEFNE